MAEFVYVSGVQLTAGEVDWLEQYVTDVALALALGDTAVAASVLRKVYGALPAEVDA